MLSNILDPNREVDPRYEGYTVLSDDGKWISGLLESDTDTSVELRLADGALSRLDKVDVDVLKSTGQSLMPEGLEQDLGKQGLADIIAYLIER